MITAAPPAARAGVIEIGAAEIDATATEAAEASMAKATEMAVTAAVPDMPAETTVPDVYDVSRRFRIEIEK